METMEGFDVNDPIDVQDLTEVKEERRLIPAVKNLKVRIVATQGENPRPRILSNANAEKGKQADIKSLGLALEIVDGIPMVDKESGESVMKYQKMKVFTGLMDLIVWANITPEREAKQWWKNKQHLVGLKNFLGAIGIPLSGLKVTDEFLQELIGKELLIDIVHEKETVMNADSGKREPTGTLRERIKAWKKA